MKCSPSVSPLADKMTADYDILHGFVEGLKHGSTKCWKKFATVQRQILASISLAMVSISYGMALAFTGTLLPLIRDYVTEEDGTWLAATNAFFMVIGAYSSIGLVPCLGNKICLIMTQVLALAGWWSLSFATKFYHFEVAFILIGFSSGFAYQISLTCRVEIAVKQFRGVISNVIVSCFMFGIFMGHLSAIILPWRLAMKCCSFVPLLSMLLIIVFFPETPSWFLCRGQIEQAEKIFFWLRGVSKESEEEFNIMKKGQSKYGTLGIFEELRKVFSKKFIVPFFIGSTLLTAQSGSGYDAMVIYTVDLLSKMSSSIDPAQVTILFDLVSWLSGILSCIVVKKMSQRSLFFISAVGTILILIALIIIIIYQMPGIMFLVCLCTYTALINVAIMPISWLVMAEIFPDGLRELGVCLSTGYFCFLTILLTKAVPFIVSIGGIVAALGFFCTVLLMCTIILYFIMPETKELSLQEIEDEIRRGKLYQLMSSLDHNRTTESES